MEHIKVIWGANLLTSLSSLGCGECQSSCQSACKTSNTVANQECENEFRRDLSDLISDDTQI
ncbi:MAG: six-cysteine ranthipeptide SCIFF [Candidatus Improbicoccus devescovinae]|nr:MAG: six-cysteine ranthipeptide SCIFF [Candidatus Improbicoccus devescovinae]